MDGHAMKPVDISILQTVFAKHNTHMVRYIWEPAEIMAWEKLIRDLSEIETVLVKEPTNDEYATTN